MAASHICPSVHSPSPSTTNTLLSFLSFLTAHAIPAPAERPIPSAPVGASIPGIEVQACSCNSDVDLFISLKSVSLLIIPRNASAAYCTPELCPLERSIISLPSHCGSSGFSLRYLPYRAAITSAIENSPPTCPDLVPAKLIKSATSLLN